MATTQQDLRDIYYDILREPQDSWWGTSAYPLTLCDLHLDAAQQKILGGRVINPISKEEVRSGKMHFKYAEAFYSNIPWTSLSTATAIGDTTIYVGDTTNYWTTWALFIAGNIVTYTGKTATSFTGCSGVLFAHQIWIQVYPAYVMPTDYGKVINVIYKNKIKLPMKGYDDIFEDLNSYKGSNRNRSMTIGYYDQPYRVAPFYTIKDAAYLIIYNFNDVNAMIKLRYERVFPDMSSIVGCAIDNDTFAKTTVPYLAVAQTLFDRGEEWRAAQIYSVAISYIREMYDWYNNTDYENISWVHYLMGRWHLNI